MNAISRILIENFQSHSKTEIRPAGPGSLTVITGPTDSGKTAVVRALRWVMYNEPQGSDFIRAGCDFARVTLELADGTLVARERGKSYNRYALVTEGQRRVLEGFGASVPAEVQELLGVRPVTFGDIEVRPNLAGQLEGPFLGTSVSAGARARVLGKLAGTEEVDLALKAVGTDLYRRGQDDKRLAKELEGLETQIKAYDYLPALKAQTEALAAILATLKDLVARKERATALRARLQEADAGIARAKATLNGLVSLPTLIKMVSTLEASGRRRFDLRVLAGRLDMVDGGIAMAEATLKKLKDLPALVEAVTTTETAADRKRRLWDLAADLCARDSDLEEMRNILTRLKDLDKAARVVSLTELAMNASTRLTRLQGQLQQLRLQHFDAWSTLKRLAGADDALNAVEQAIAAEGRRRTLLYRADALKTMEQSTSAVRARLPALVAAGQAAEILPAIEAGMSRQTTILRGRRQLVDLDRRILTGKEATQEQIHVAEDLTREYRETLAAAGRCPVCGSTIDPERLKEAV